MRFFPFSILIVLHVSYSLEPHNILPCVLMINKLHKLDSSFNNLSIYYLANCLIRLNEKEYFVIEDDEYFCAIIERPCYIYDELFVFIETIPMTARGSQYYTIKLICVFASSFY